eukprot:TRINITY_DN1631_c0_g2_i1.p1 TRINITY_DN1631_c0_g2~~TRINITY_DN1631_c0_g2_i1.p1  ORF type:complete len:549 (+),score=161.03 TRINITY_DN1631_c0_g2_i1:147-1793(+)
MNYNPLNLSKDGIKDASNRLSSYSMYAWEKMTMKTTPTATSPNPSESEKERSPTQSSPEAEVEVPSIDPHTSASELRTLNVAVIGVDDFSLREFKACVELGQGIATPHPIKPKDAPTTAPEDQLTPISTDDMTEKLLTGPSGRTIRVVFQFFDLSSTTPKKFSDVAIIFICCQSSCTNVSELVHKSKQLVDGDPKVIVCCTDSKSRTDHPIDPMPSPRDANSTNASNAADDKKKKKASVFLKPFKLSRSSYTEEQQKQFPANSPIQSFAAGKSMATEMGTEYAEIDVCFCTEEELEKLFKFVAAVFIMNLSNPSMSWQQWVATCRCVPAVPLSKEMIRKIRGDSPASTRRRTSTSTSTPTSTPTSTSTSTPRGDSLMILVRVLAPIIVHKLMKMKIPPIKFKNDYISLGVGDMRLEKIVIDPTKIRLDSTENSFQFTTTDIGGHLKEFFWEFSRDTFPKIQDKGKANASITNARMSITMAIKDPEVIVERCEVTMENIDVVISGSAVSAVYNLILGMMKNTIKSTIENSVRKKILKLLSQTCTIAPQK